MKHTERIKARKFTYTALFEEAEEGGYVVSFPDVPGAATQGETLKQAREMAAECLELHLEALQERGDPLPTPGRSSDKYRLEEITVKLKSA